MTDNKTHKDYNDKGKLSARMSLFAWLLCAVLGWAVALTTLNSLSSGGNIQNDAAITAENAPSQKDAVKMEKILPAAGNK